MFIHRLLKVIRKIFRVIVKPSRYFINMIKYGPYSRKYGFDRGEPIDRKWIEDFLMENSEYVCGRVLEVTNNYYTRKFGGSKVTISDVLDINTSNKNANIHADLRNPECIDDCCYDCVILTHVLGLIDDIDSAISHLYRILKPGGRLLFTSSSLGPVLGQEVVYWRFNSNTVRYIFSKKFRPEKIHVSDRGNAYLGCAMWMGLSQQDVDISSYDFNDRQYPCNVVAIITK